VRLEKLSTCEERAYSSAFFSSAVALSLALFFRMVSRVLSEQHDVQYRDRSHGIVQTLLSAYLRRWLMAWST